jgi:hypothetical protein
MRAAVHRLMLVTIRRHAAMFQRPSPTAAARTAWRTCCELTLLLQPRGIQRTRIPRGLYLG